MAGWSVCVWTKDGLVEIAEAHDKADAERTRDDFTGRPGIPGTPFIAPRRQDG